MIEKHEITPNIENPESTLNRATKDDIPGIINVQESRSLAKMIKEGVEKDLIERTGFLVHLLTESELEELIEKTDEVKVLVYKDGKEIVGYALGYLMRQWKEKHPEWINTIKLKDGKKLEEITDESTIYFRHVATPPTARPGTGAGLSRELVKELQDEGFKNIVGEILKEPFLNRPSFLVHTRMKFEEVGEIDETSEGENYKWGLFLKVFFNFGLGQVFSKKWIRNPARIPSQTLPCGRKISRGRANPNPRLNVSPCRVLFSSFNHLDFARNNFELCPVSTALRNLSLSCVIIQLLYLIFYLCPKNM